MSLTRIVNIFKGSIKIDGVDISKISLQQVRDAITIIPQEPVLFKGTMRFNVDPTESCTDEEIRKVLIDAELDKFILNKKEEDDKTKKEKEEKLKEYQERINKAGRSDAHEAKYDQEYDLLNFKIERGGGNLSSGEKALVCICRAILRKSKVVILDEATASIDLKTEQFI